MSGPKTQGRGDVLIAAAAFLLLFAIMGAGFYCIPLYVSAVPTETGLSPTLLAAAATTFFVVSSVTSPLVARALIRWSIPSVVAISGVIGSGALLMLGVAHTTATLMASFVLLALGVAGAGLIPAMSAIVTHFGDRAGRVTVIATLGMPFSGLLITPSVSFLIHRYGFEIALRALAGLFAALIVIAVVLLTLAPATDRHAASTDAEAPAGDPGFMATLRTPAFRWVAGAATLLLLTQNSALTHMIALGDQRSIGASHLTITVISIMSVCGRLAILPFVRKVPAARFTALIALDQVVAAVLLSVAHTSVTLIVAVIFLGFSVANVIVVIPLVAADLVSSDAYPVYYGRVWSVAGTVSAFGPLAVGLIRSGTGGYAIPMLCLGCGSLVAAVALWRGPRRAKIRTDQSLQPSTGTVS